MTSAEDYTDFCFYFNWKLSALAEKQLIKSNSVTHYNHCVTMSWVPVRTERIYIKMQLLHYVYLSSIKLNYNSIKYAR